MTDLNEEKLLDLLCKKATDGLDTGELEEFERLENAFPAWRDDHSYETAAAVINMNAVEPGEMMPAQLKARIAASAEEFFEAGTPAMTGSVRESQSGIASAAKEYGENVRSSFTQWLGWGAAALACVALAFNVYLTRFQAPEMRAGSGAETVQTPPAELSGAQEFEQLRNSGKAIIVSVASADPKEMISGDIVWNSSEQKGYMRFRGMPVNDPAKSTYQLWIFDKTQDEKYPVDGGVFDISKDGEIIIPIDAKINVKDPVLFAVTKEKPGGVVVSDRKGIIAVAKV